MCILYQVNKRYNLTTTKTNILNILYSPNLTAATTELLQQSKQQLNSTQQLSSRNSESTLENSLDVIPRVRMCL